jgi:UDP-galactopyranose mutase
MSPDAILRAPLVCFSNLDWGYLRYRKQHLMCRLARARRVVYVNPPRAAKWRLPHRWHRLTPIDGNLEIYDPLVLPGRRRSAFVTGLNDRLIAAGIRRRSRLDAPFVLWIYSPHALSFVDLLSPDLVVYDMADDCTVPSGPVVRDGVERREVERLRVLEGRLLERADLVLCASRPLADKARAVASEVHVVPNGCDFEAYDRVVPLPRPAGSRPRIGYVGTIAPRFDFDLALEIALRCPEWDVELVGPVTAGAAVHTAGLPPNLRLAGAIPYRDVPARIRSFDVAILPLREIPFAYRSSPIQVFDYLAAGKPVVATPVTDLEPLTGLVATARGPAEFVGQIADALVTDSAGRIARRRRFARANSWDERVRVVSDLLVRSAARPARSA